MTDKLFYDIEIFQEDAMVVFMDEQGSVRVRVNDFSDVHEIIKDKALVGYNNYYYDDHILTAMMDGWSNKQLKNLNDEIIGGTNRTRKVKSTIKSLDCFQQILTTPSLKKLEGNMGKSIVESPISFNIDRKLTDDELELVFKYCLADVENTARIYEHRKEYFSTKEMLLEMLGNDRARTWNTTTIAAKLLVEKQVPKWSGLRIEDWMMDMVDPAVSEMWVKAAGELGKRDHEGNITLERFDNDITFGFGGLHGVHKHITKANNVRLLDVTSMYPNIIINLNALGPATSKYKEILDERVRIKHTEPVKQEALKLILNSTYGLMKNQYSVLDNPRAALTVCVYGQIALYRLCEMIDPYVTIININTDGVAFVPKSEDYKDRVPEWEEQFNLKLEEKHYDKFIQKDVNNYITVKDGKVDKVIGADTKRYKKDSVFSNNNARILDIALVDNLVYGKDVVDTLQDNLDRPELYQYILDHGTKYEATVDDEGNRYQRVNRVFAAQRGNTCLQKFRDGSKTMFADAPEKMYVWNHDVNELKGFDGIVDLNHYYQVITKRLQRWK